MKYVLIPILKVAWVLFAVGFMLPFIYVLEFASSIWHWDFNNLKSVHEAFTEDFNAESTFVEPGEKYWVHRNPIDYLVDKKTWRVKDPEWKDL